MNKFSKHVLDFDKDAEISKIDSEIKKIVAKKLRKRGVVVAMSGGIDSSVSATLAVQDAQLAASENLVLTTSPEPSGTGFFQ